MKNLGVICNALGSLTLLWHFLLSRPLSEAGSNTTVLPASFLSEDTMRPVMPSLSHVANAQPSTSLSVSQQVGIIGYATKILFHFFSLMGLHLNF